MESLSWQAELFIFDVSASECLEDGLERLLEDVGRLLDAASKANDQRAIRLTADAQALLILRLAQPTDVRIGQQFLPCGSHESSNSK